VSSCEPCNAGRYSTSGSKSCIICPSGRYSNKADQANQCTACPSGKYNSDAGTNVALHNSVFDCMNCGSGGYSSYGSSSCKNCPAGKYSVASTSCSICAAGKYSSSGYSSCTDCPQGKYNDDNGNVANHDSSSDCSDCVVGTFSDTLGASSSSTCTDCAAGSYSETAASSSCRVCVAGKFVSSSRSTACNVCPAGKINVDPATSADLHTSCDACPRGKRNNFDESEVYMHNSADDCTLCLPGMFSDDANGATSCTACTTGKTSGAGEQLCSECPAGYECADGDRVACSEGFFSSDNSACQVSHDYLVRKNPPKLTTIPAVHRLAQVVTSAPELPIKYRAHQATQGKIVPNQLKLKRHRAFHVKRESINRMKDKKLAYCVQLVVFAPHLRWHQFLVEALPFFVLQRVLQFLSQLLGTTRPQILTMLLLLENRNNHARRVLLAWAERKPSASLARRTRKMLPSRHASRVLLALPGHSRPLAVRPLLTQSASPVQPVLPAWTRRR